MALAPLVAGARRRAGRTAPLLLCALVALTMPPPAFAEHDFQVWATTAVQTPQAGPWRLYFDVQPRWTRDATDFSRVVYRGDLSRTAGARWKIGGGYEHYDGLDRRALDERRIFQYATLRGRRGAWTLEHRFRVEERFLRVADGVSARARYQLRASRSFGRGGAWGVAASEEVLVTANSVERGPRAGFDQSRLVGSLSRRLSPRVAVEPGYMYQVTRVPGRDALVSHVLQARLTTTF